MAEEKKTTTKKAAAPKKAAEKAENAAKVQDLAEKPAKKAPAKNAAKPQDSSEAPAKKAPAKKVKSGNKQPSEHNRLLDKYNNEIKASLVEKYHYSSIMMCPRLEKIVINVGVGDAITDHKAIEDVVGEIALITGQHPVVTKAKKSIASFKLREGQAIGVKVTLRGIRMYEFLDKLVSISLPRVRDFRGVSRNSFDGHGNYTLGIKEQLIFPEIDYDKVNKIRGMDIVIVTTANTDEEAYSLLEGLGMPFHR